MSEINKEDPELLSIINDQNESLEDREIKRHREAVIYWTRRKMMRYYEEMRNDEKRS